MHDPLTAVLPNPRRERAEQLRQTQLRRALRRLGHLHERDRAVVESLSEDLVTALLPLASFALLEEQRDTPGGGHE